MNAAKSPKPTVVSLQTSSLVLPPCQPLKSQPKKFHVQLDNLRRGHGPHWVALTADGLEGLVCQQGASAQAQPADVDVKPRCLQELIGDVLQA